MSMPSANRTPAPTPPTGTKYGKDLHGNAYPFQPAPVKYLDSSISKLGSGVTAIPNTVPGENCEEGTGKHDSP